MPSSAAFAKSLGNVGWSLNSSRSFRVAKIAPATPHSASKRARLAALLGVFPSFSAAPIRRMNRARSPISRSLCQGVLLCSRRRGGGTILLLAPHAPLALIGAGKDRYGDRGDGLDVAERGESVPLLPRIVWRSTLQQPQNALGGPVRRVVRVHPQRIEGPQIGRAHV